MPSEWVSYDQVAADYDRLVPDSYRDLARDLVAGLRLSAGGLVLDAGTGTGAAALLAAETLGRGGTVVGIDPSLGMLRRARANGIAPLVVGVSPGLPFRDGVFDAAMGNLVLSHFARYETALLDLARVLKRGSRLGVTAWAAGQTEFHQLWRESVVGRVGGAAFQDAIRQNAPWEQWFLDPQHLREALHAAGLENVDVQQREYQVSLTIAGFLSFMEISAVGRCVRWMLTLSQWEAFRATTADQFRTRFRDPIEYTSGAHIAVGSKP